MGQLKSKFERGSSTYRCQCCGKLTRDTGQDEVEGICARCYDEGGWENEHTDTDGVHSLGGGLEGPAPEFCPTCRGRGWWEV